MPPDVKCLYFIGYARRYGSRLFVVDSLLDLLHFQHKILTLVASCVKLGGTVDSDIDLGSLLSA